MNAPSDDFKTSTRSMLEVVRGEKARLKQRMDELDEREKIILSWIEKEEGPFQHDLPMAAGRSLVQPRRAKPTMRDLFREVMQDGRARTNAELAELAKLRGIAGDDLDLRAVNSTMLSLMNAGGVARKDDKWVITK